MAVAWVGNREASLDRAVEEIVSLLATCRNPVFSLRCDVDGTRAALALARVVGATCHHGGGPAMDAEVALMSESGGIFTSPGEARRRADLLAAVGQLPETHREFAAGLAGSKADLGAAGPRRLFAIGRGKLVQGAFGSGGKAVAVGAPGLGTSESLAALRAALSGRPVAVKLSNIQAFAEALSTARYVVFLCAGEADEPLALEMLQGLIADLNRKQRAAALMLTSCEPSWTAIQASCWVTGAPLPLRFDCGEAAYDPAGGTVAQAQSLRDSDLLLDIGGSGSGSGGGPGNVIVIASTARPARGARITIAVGAPGQDHDGVLYRASMGTLSALAASSPSEAPRVADVLRAIGRGLAERGGGS